MCGIAGKLSFNFSASREEIKLMNDAQIHRGPDGEGIWISENKKIALGHRRLSILDLSDAGKQPMKSLCGRYVITFNGEIYNYIELREELEKEGYIFRSNTDTEVLLNCYIHYGKSFLTKLNGMFAFCIWDNKDEVIFCARDRFGEKPFHYYYNDGDFYFASEMKALWAVGVPRLISEEALYDYLVFDTIENIQNRDITFYKNIKKLDASHSLKLDKKGNINIERYWSLDGVKKNECISLEDAIAELKKLLVDSVSIRLRSDVPIGSSLSGGLDSSILVKIIDEIKAGSLKQKTFTARFENFIKDEGENIERFLRTINVDSFFTWPTADNLNHNFEKLIYHQEEPFGSASIFAQWEVMKLAKSHGTIVLLDGQGADEQFAGYTYFLDYYYRSIKKSNYSLYKNELKQYEKKNNISWNKPLVKKIKNEYPGFYNRLQLIKNFGKKDSIYDFIDEKFLTEYNLRKTHKPKLKGLTRNIKDSLLNGQLQELLRYADRNSMAHSVEVRLPYLDHRLVEFILSLPDSYLIKDGFPKYILRKAFEDVLPNEITWQKNKISFEPPQKEWLENSMRINQIKSSKKYYSSDIFKVPFKVSAETLFYDHNIPK